MNQEPVGWSVATWNVNSINAHERHVLDWVEQHQPTLLAMQETQCSRGRFPMSGFHSLGYEIAAVGESGLNGVALASRVGLADVTLGVPGAPAPFDEARIISATINVRPSEAVRVMSAYAPNGRKVGTDHHRFKVAWFELLRAVVDNLDEGEIVLAADLNVAPTDLDVWDPQRYRNRNLTSPADRSAFARLIDGGLVDVVRAKAGEDRLSSWWNRRGDFFESDRGWRLDHVLCSPGLASRVRGFGIDREARAVPGSSDHAPLVVSFSG